MAGNDPIADIRKSWESRDMQSPSVALSAALRGREVRVFRREADWGFDFGERLHIAASVPWRIVTGDGIAHGDEDDGQQFGLPQRIDGEARVNTLLSGQRVSKVEVDGETADLRVVFDGGARLDFFNNSSGYEGWQASVPVGEEVLTVVALGGGELTAV
ncbi:hypothetical protein K3172_05690 [Qipengyuania sp. 6B39]|uniref:DUF6188 family protein n=1 Tax=Qipengyuania proteolytica TaxID=2867239 RepID=UPI001C89635A|nr:DUF6188 family protein [Qipengyuania proteolytica]MBX7495344.1 hypothetical protein [Qipengyuania proteolytica]